MNINILALGTIKKRMIITLKIRCVPIVFHTNGLITRWTFENRTPILHGRNKRTIRAAKLKSFPEFLSRLSVRGIA